MAETARHVLVVTGEHRDDQTYSIECPGISGTCRMWVECSICYPQKWPDGFDFEAWDDRMWDGDGMAHDVEHEHIDGSWMVPTDRCFVRYAEGMEESAVDLGVGPGRYPVEHQFDEGFVTLTLAEVTKEEANR